MLLEWVAPLIGEEPEPRSSQLWLAIANDRTKIIALSEDIFIPELSI